MRGPIQILTKKVRTEGHAPTAPAIISQATEYGNAKIQTAKARLASSQRGAEDCFRTRAPRLDLPALSTTGRACHHRVVDRGRFWAGAHQGRRFAQPAVSIRHARVQNLRGGDTARPLERIRWPYRRRGRASA